MICWKVKMEANKTTLFQLLNGEKQFRIPIYQRPYSWKQTECTRLLDDINDIANTTEGVSHFLGSVVYVAEADFLVAGVNNLLVIDGQQRLTTLSLLLLAIRHVIQNKKIDIGVKPQALGNYYLFNANENETERNYLKLQLTRSDKQTYEKICRSIPLDPSDDNRVRANFEFFVSNFESEKYDPKTIYSGIQRLQLVYIALDRGKDNPQLIFESMNSTGLDLAQADLIRNFVLMGLNPDLQSNLYDRYWFPMEQLFGTQYRDRFDSFMRTFLTVKVGKIPRENEVYLSFKKYVASVEGDAGASGLHLMERIAKELFEEANHYSNIVLGTEKDHELKSVFADFTALRAEVAHPFLLALYGDWKANLLNREQLLQLVRLTESYVFRRAICGIPTSSMNKMFATLMNKVDKSRYFRSVQAEFLRLATYRRYPGDTEVIQSLVQRDIYNTPRCAYLLERLENYYHPKEPIKAADYTIEHIMPQNLSSEWRSMLGDTCEEIHEKYLHTLGNLTLTGYNSELSDRPFLEKRNLQEGGFKSSPLRLNALPAKQEKWTEQQILDRCSKLSADICSVWPYPDASVLTEFAIEETQEKEVYDLNNYPQLKGAIGDLYSSLEHAVLELSPDIRRDIKKLYIAFKLETNFVDVIPQSSCLVLSINLSPDKLEDPKGLCRDVTGLGRWGNGDVEFRLSDSAHLPYALSIIQQALDEQLRETS